MDSRNTLYNLEYDNIELGSNLLRIRCYDELLQK